MSYLSAGKAIKERLEQLNLYRVYSSRDVDMGKSQAQKAPCVFVSYYGESGIEKHGRSHLVTQVWIVMVAIANERANTTGDQANDVAGDMLDVVIGALINHPPGSGMTPLEFIQSPLPHGYDDKFLYYPVAFSTTIRMTGENNGC